MRVSRPRPSGAPLVAPRAALLATLLAAGCTDRSTPAAPDRADGAPALVPAPPLLGLVGADHTYREGFDFLFDPSGAPLTAGWPVHPPTPWKPTDFDVAIHFRDPGTWYRPVPFRAMHGTGCGSFQTATPPYSVVPGDMGSHQVGTYDDLNFRCRNHMMTALKTTGYAGIYVTPNAMVDFASGEASVKWAMSTLRTATNDWVDLWITPWEDNLALPLDASLIGTDLQGPPRRALHLRMAYEPKARTRFELYVVNNFAEAKMPVVSTNGYESFMAPVSQRRDTFELRLSRFRVQFGMKKVATPGESAAGITWVDAPVFTGWTRGVVQFGHHAMNPTDGRADGVGGTWHWDDVTIAPAVPFTIITPKLVGGARVRYVDAATAGTPVEFARAAPSDSYLRFAAFGTAIQVSVDGGASWSDARRQPAFLDRADRFRSYWTPIPAGVSAVRFRHDGASPASWLVRDMTIWSLTP